MCVCLTNGWAWLGGQDERDDQAVQAQDLGEDEYENHADVQTGLLGRSAHTRVSHNADGEASGQARQADAQASSQVMETPTIFDKIRNQLVN